MNLKVQCINRLLDKKYGAELLDFLINEKFIDSKVYQNMDNNKSIAQATYLAINTALSDGVLLLADFEWSLLPRERVHITIVAPKIHKEFSYDL